VAYAAAYTPNLLNFGCYLMPLLQSFAFPDKKFSRYTNAIPPGLKQSLFQNFSNKHN